MPSNKSDKEKLQTGVSKAKTKKAKVKAAVKETRKGKGAEEMQRLRIRISAYENKILDNSVKQIMNTALRYDAKIHGPVPLPTSIKKYTVNRGAFVHKDAREQFEMRIHKRLIDIDNPSPKIIESLSNIDLPSGVNIDVKMS